MQYSRRTKLLRPRIKENHRAAHLRRLAIGEFPEEVLAHHRPTHEFIGQFIGEQPVRSNETIIGSALRQAGKTIGNYAPFRMLKKERPDQGGDFLHRWAESKRDFFWKNAQLRFPRGKITGKLETHCRSNHDASVAREIGRAFCMETSNSGAGSTTIVPVAVEPACRNLPCSALATSSTGNDGRYVVGRSKVGASESTPRYCTPSTHGRDSATPITASNRAPAMPSRRLKWSLSNWSSRLARRRDASPLAATATGSSGISRGHHVSSSWCGCGMFLSAGGRVQNFHDGVADFRQFGVALFRRKTRVHFPQNAFQLKTPADSFFHTRRLCHQNGAAGICKPHRSRHWARRRLFRRRRQSGVFRGRQQIPKAVASDVLLLRRRHNKDQRPKIDFRWGCAARQESRSRNQKLRLDGAPI